MFNMMEIQVVESHNLYTVDLSVQNTSAKRTIYIAKSLENWVI